MSAPTFGQTLRAWRLRTTPAHVGLTTGPVQRRTPGLRREELADLAGISSDYLQRLEGGRARPSRGLAARLANALLLSTVDSAALLHLAGYHDDPAERMPREVTASVRRLLARSTTTPIAVYDAGWTWRSANRAWSVLFRHVVDAGSPAHNLADTVFLGGWDAIDHGDLEQSRRYLVGELRRAASRYPTDPELVETISHLVRDPRFARAWAAPGVHAHRPQRKTVSGTEAGSIQLDCDVLTPSDGDLRLVVLTAVPGSADESRLSALLSRGASTSEQTRTDGARLRI